MTENIDSTTIDTEHARLRDTGYRFLTNATRDGSLGLGLDASVRLWEAEGYEVVTCQTAYDIYGNPMPTCVSLWGKKSPI